MRSFRRGESIEGLYQVRPIRGWLKVTYQVYKAYERSPLDNSPPGVAPDLRGGSHHSLTRPAGIPCALQSDHVCAQPQSTRLVGRLDMDEGVPVGFMFALADAMGIVDMVRWSQQPRTPMQCMAKARPTDRLMTHPLTTNRTGVGTVQYVTIAAKEPRKRRNRTKASLDLLNTQLELGHESVKSGICLSTGSN